MFTKKMNVGNTERVDEAIKRKTTVESANVSQSQLQTLPPSSIPITTFGIQSPKTKRSKHITAPEVTTVGENPALPYAERKKEFINILDNDTSKGKLLRSFFDKDENFSKFLSVGHVFYCNCGYTTFENLSNCRTCKANLNQNKIVKVILTDGTDIAYSTYRSHQVFENNESKKIYLTEEDKKILTAQSNNFIKEFKRHQPSHPFNEKIKQHFSVIENFKAFSDSGKLSYCKTCSKIDVGNTVCLSCSSRCRVILRDCTDMANSTFTQKYLKTGAPPFSATVLNISNDQGTTNAPNTTSQSSAPRSNLWLSLVLNNEVTGTDANPNLPVPPVEFVFKPGNTSKS